MPAAVPYNKQLQRTVKRHRGRDASASFHYALASLGRRQRPAAELRRYAAQAAFREAIAMSAFDPTRQPRSGIL
jgi:SOS response regulatory protein OraA/RecX